MYAFGMQVLLTQDPAVGLAWLDTPLTDLPFLARALEAAAKLAHPTMQAAAIRRLVDWRRVSGPGSAYDALGDVGRPNHLLLPPDGGLDDPARYHTPSVGGYTRDDALRISSQRAAFALYDANLTLRFDGLDPRQTYQLTVQFHRPFHRVNPPTSDQNRVRLVANGHTVLQPYAIAPSEPTTYALPQADHLTLTCNAPPGVGGSGRVCGIAEVWLSVVSRTLMTA